MKHIKSRFRACSLKALVLIFASGFCYSSHAQDTSWLKKLLWKQSSDSFRNILSNPDSFRCQIIYTRIDRDAKNQPLFKSFYFNVDSTVYFNPASTVKLPLALLALEKINKLKAQGIDRSTPLMIDSAYSGQSRVEKDSSSANGFASIENYVKKIFLVSDNDAYNRLYEFLGQQYINERLWQMGYPQVRITRRFVPMTEEENRHTNAVRFLKTNGKVYTQPAQYSTVSFNFSRDIRLGRVHYDRNDSLINAPMDFTRHNNLPLADLNAILQSVIFPASVSKKQRFDLKASDYPFLYRYMSEYPFESSHPKYDTSEYFQSYCKFFYRSGKRSIPQQVRIFNKPGWSYGFLSDAAYVVDFKNRVEFMLTAVIYVNKDGILNDGKYEYEEMGWPFFRELYEIIYRYERERPRKYRPDLSTFRMNYQK